MDTGLRAIHPVTGEQLPVFVANFVLMGYGTGAVMAVPGHDERDWEFAQQVRAADPHGDRAAGSARRAGEIATTWPSTTTRCAARSAARRRRRVRHRPRCRWSRSSNAHREESAYTERGWLVNSGEFDGLDYQQAFDALATRFERRRPRPAPRQLPPARLGRDAASATGAARSR